MKKIVLLFIVFLSAFNKNISAQCAESNETKVLLVGDSWAFFMGVDQTINNALKKWGHSNYKYLTNATVAENGAQTDDFLTATKQNEITKLISQNPSIEVIHLSIGGNDVLGSWKVSNSASKTDSLFVDVSARLKAVITFLKTTKPGIKIVWSGYAYPNFEEVITTSSLGTNHPFYGTWQKMEFPTSAQLNPLLNRFSDSIAAYCLTDTQVKFYKATGLMQYTFGQTSALGVAPGGTYPAYTVPQPEGKLDYPSPKTSMRDYLLTKDCFHLSAKGFLDLIEFHTQKFYQKYLMDDLYALAANTNQNGSVSSTGALSSQLQLGEQSGESFSSVLTFNTSGMADTTLKKASIFLRRESLTGTNPISGNIQVKIKSGFLGNADSVEVADITAVADATGNPCLFGSNGGDGHWIRLDLPVSFFPFINKTKPVQFLISVPGFTGGKVVFSNGSNPELAPVLNLAYGQTPLAVEEINPVAPLNIYPNPVKNSLQFDLPNKNIERIEITNTLGQQMAVKRLSENSIQTTGLTSGSYFLTIVTKDGNVTKKFIKE